MSDERNAAAQTLGGSTAPWGAGAAAYDDLPPGFEVGRYVVLHRIGAGAMGVVYAAYDPHLDRKIALKILGPDARGPSRRARRHLRLLREAQAMARVQHPNVLEVLDVGTFAREHAGDDGRVYVAMKLVEGKTLTHWLAQRPRPWSEVVEVFLAAGRGLAAAHLRGLVHRDFKPDNVLIGDEGGVWVTDFGLARAIGPGSSPGDDSAALEPDGPDALRTAMTRTGALLGTPAYMAPEQLRGQSVDARADQFSFCVALFEALYGVRPFEGQSVADLLLGIAEGDMRAPPAQSGVPSRIHRAVLRGLSVKPDERFVDMQALLSALQRRRHTGRYAVAGVAVVGGLGLASVAAWPSPSRCDAAPERLEGIWDDVERQRVREALLGTGVSYAEDSWSRVETTLDERARSWVDTWNEACVAADAPGASARELDERMACLDGRRSELQAAVRALIEVDRDFVARSVDVVDGLAPARGCLRAEATTNRIPRPGDERVRVEVEAVRQRLATATALEDIGDYERAHEVATEAARAAEAIEYPPIRAEAWLRAGSTHELLGGYDRARTLLERAYFEADKVRHDAVASTAAIHLVALYGLQLADATGAATWQRHAQSVLDRSEAAPDARADLLGVVGDVAFAQGRYQDALQRHTEALALRRKESTEKSDGLAIARSLTSLANAQFRLGRMQDARHNHERALRVREQVLGTMHPVVGESLGNVAAVHRRQGRHEDARDALQRALSIFESALGVDHPYVAMAHNNLFGVYRDLGRDDAAIEHLQAALSGWKRSLGETHPNVAYAYANLAAFELDAGHPEAAADAAQKAIDVIGDDHRITAVALGTLARAHSRLGAHQDAVAAAERAVDILQATEVEQADVDAAHEVLAEVREAASSE